MAQTTLSRSADSLIDTADVFFAQHEKLGNLSPMNSLPDNDFGKAKAAFLKYKAFNVAAKEYDKLARQQRELRDKQFDGFYDDLLAAKNLILALNVKNPKAAEDFGFKTVKKPTQRSPKSKPVAAVSDALTETNNPS